MTTSAPAASNWIRGNFFTLLAVAASWCCSITCLGQDAQQGRDRPNFVVINIDDLGYADIGPFGSTLNRTPNLDRMAQEGRKLTCFYAAPVCSPSRAALMTGCYPKRSLSIPHVLFPGNAEGLHPDEITVAELLRQQGYATAIIGKWHLGDQPEFLPLNQGFDYFYGLPYSNDMGPAVDGVKSNLDEPLPQPRGRGQPPLPLLRNNQVLQRVRVEDQRQLVARYTDEAVQFLRDHRQRPFFLYLPHSAVHFPLYPSERFHGKSGNGLYGDWVEEVDWSVGRVLDTLRELNLSERTLVLFTSDNGGAVGHGAINRPLRGGKGSTHEGGMRVPTIAWWPSRIPAATSTDAITGMIDILPTFVNLAGGQVPADRRIDGGDIWPLLAGVPSARSPHDVFYYYRGLKLEAVREGNWKLRLGNNALFHLKQDIGESNNVAADHAGVVQRLREHAQQMADDLGLDELGPGCRPLGRVSNPQPLIDHDGNARSLSESESSAAPGDGNTTSPIAGMGIMVGEVTANSAVVQVRLTTSDQLIDGDVPGAAGVVRFMIRPISQSIGAGPAGDLSATELIPALAERDYIARAVLRELRPATAYECSTMVGADEHSLRPGPRAIFRTLAGSQAGVQVRFVVVTGMNYARFHGGDRNDRRQNVIENNPELPPSNGGADKRLGYPALETIRHLEPDFLIGTGDNVYYDTPSNPRATTLEQMRQKWHEQFVQPRFRELFASVPTYWEIDDHDYRYDDTDNSGDKPPSPELGRRVMLEQLPLADADDDQALTYRTHRLSRDVQIWLTENRMYRSPNSMNDGPDKSIWGVQQREWLMRTLQQSNATFKILVSPTPMIGPDDLRKTDNHADIGGFRHERDAFFAWLKQTGIDRHFSIVCGDRHWQYHSISPEGLQEFSCGALVDANSRLGRRPGDPQSTDPDAVVQQPYTQDKAGGGFLLVQVDPARDAQPATLCFRYHDKLGKTLYEHIISAGD